MIIQALVFSLIAFGQASEENVNPPTISSPCHDYFDYLCAQPFAQNLTKKPYALSLSLEVEQQQEYNFNPGYGQRSVFEVVNLTLISSWIVEFRTFKNGVKWEEHKRKHQEFLGLNPEQQEKNLVETLEEIPIHTIANFYNQLSAGLELVKTIKGTGTKSHYFHPLFEKLRKKFIQNIERYSSFTPEQRAILIKQLEDTKVFFAVYDYNDPKKWLEAKKTYEREYFRLKEQVIPREMFTNFAEKIIRIAAVEPTVKLFHEYMNDFTEQFVFQAIFATPTPDCFNYQKELFISVLGRGVHIDDEVFTDTLYVMSHELSHSIYNLENPTFELETWQNEKQCVVDYITYLAETDNQKMPIEWRLDTYIYEDVANMNALRLSAQFSQDRKESDEEKRKRIEKTYSRFCFGEKNGIKSNHNPTGHSVNLAASQLPSFNELYNCQPTDRLYVSPEKLCKTMAITIDPKIYGIKNEEAFTTTTTTIAPTSPPALEITTPITEINPTENEKDNEIVIPNETNFNRTSENYSSSTTKISIFISLVLVFLFN
ncbi:unnamed protein product [Caenorhabditis angaria]|uniref:Peptidase M13 C-terminal domain-containing protein n=1 Tax=Caenorhabditis angaria TaxID=860376 RepID=A0A9P1NBR2_9PELO|nr:unnamed protein product [Caenorhabditis angaria]